jgi:hypothetical protein
LFASLLILLSSILTCILQANSKCILIKKILYVDYFLISFILFFSIFLISKTVQTPFSTHILHVPMPLSGAGLGNCNYEQLKDLRTVEAAKTAPTGEGFR